MRFLGLLGFHPRDLTHPIEVGVEAALPVVVGFVAIVFAVGFVIGWIRRRVVSSELGHNPRWEEKYREDYGWEE
jgi:hypothetical protein